MDVNRAAEIAYDNGYKLGIDTKEDKFGVQFIRGFLKATEGVDLTEQRCLDLRKLTLEHLKDACLSTTDKECIRAMFRLVEKREAEIDDLQHKLAKALNTIEELENRIDDLELEVEHHNDW
jgi:secreted Zn-dependent insulinase-like peptidase